MKIEKDFIHDAFRNSKIGKVLIFMEWTLIFTILCVLLAALLDLIMGVVLYTDQLDKLVIFSLFIATVFSLVLTFSSSVSFVAYRLFPPSKKSVYSAKMKHLDWFEQEIKDTEARLVELRKRCENFEKNIFPDLDFSGA